MSRRLIPLAALTFAPDEFSKRVSDYVAEHNAWSAHMRRVKADAEANVSAEARHQPYPAPAPANEQVGSCVKLDDSGDAYEDYVIHYPEGPSPEQIFAEKQRKLFDAVASAEHAASAAVIHPRKMRLFDLQVGVALQTVEADRTSDQVALIDHARQLNAKLSAVAMHAATLEAEIADLSPDMIDAWQLSPFA